MFIANYKYLFLGEVRQPLHACSGGGCVPTFVDGWIGRVHTRLQCSHLTENANGVLATATVWINVIVTCKD